MLLLLILATAHIAGVYSMWAQRMTGFHKVLRVIAYWIGIPMIAVGVLLRIRYVSETTTGHRAEKVERAR
jgi:hypothetical protein